MSPHVQLNDNPRYLTGEDWQKTESICLSDPETGKILYTCDGVLRGRLMYFTASFRHPTPVNMVLMDSESNIINYERLDKVRGPFGPGVIIRRNY